MDGLHVYQGLDFDRPGEAFPSTSPRTFLKRIQVKKGENDMFQFFPVNMHVAPQSSHSQCILGGTLSVHTPMPRLCPGIARNDQSWSACKKEQMAVGML